MQQNLGFVNRIRQEKLLPEKKFWWIIERNAIRKFVWRPCELPKDIEREPAESPPYCPPAIIKSSLGRPQSAALKRKKKMKNPRTRRFILTTALALLVVCGGWSTTLSQKNDEPSTKNATEEWKPATFRGITVGVDTRQKAFEVLGSPLLLSRFEHRREDDSFYWDAFVVEDELITRLLVQSSKQTGVISVIQADLNKVPVERVFDRYGSNDHLTRVKFGGCDSKSTNSIAYYYLYPSLGIAVPTVDGGKTTSNIFFLEGRPDFVLLSCTE
jgi:hypothetical protein